MNFKNIDLFLVATFGLVGVFVFHRSQIFRFFPAGRFTSLVRLQDTSASLFYGWMWLCASSEQRRYAFGKSRIKSFFADSFFHKSILNALAFYEKYGKRPLSSRDCSDVRTFAPIFAGVGGMEYRTLFPNIIGGVGWSTLLIFLGFGLGSFIEYHHIFSIILLIM